MRWGGMVLNEIDLCAYLVGACGYQNNSCQRKPDKRRGPFHLRNSGRHNIPLIRRKLRQPAQPLIDRREVCRRHVKELLEAVDDKVGLLVAVDLVARAHGALQLQRQALRLGALHGVGQLARGAEDACP